MKTGFYTEQVDAFFTELQEESIRNLRKIDAEYNDWRAAHAEASQEYEAILNDLPNRDMKLALYLPRPRMYSFKDVTKQ